ncbi:MAG: hypothetical protein KBE04_14685 [Phycisphaerae bacterium]|nr:hypothetical protein [Phycisphaerae bacterium]
MKRLLIDTQAINGSIPRWGSERVQEAIVVFLFFLWLRLAVGLHLLFHGAGVITNFPSFYTTWGFFLDHTSYPGGPTEYLSAFLSQLLYIPWLGAMVVAVQAWAFCLCVAYLLEAAGLGSWRVFRYVPAMLLLVIYGRYTYHFPATLAVLTALGLACGVVAIGRRWPGRPTRLAGFFAAFVIGYLLAGGAALILALICVLWECLFVKDWRAGWICAVWAAAMPYVIGVLGFGVSLVDAYTRLLPFSWRVLYYEPRSRYITVVYVLAGFVPVILGAGGAIRLAVDYYRRHRAKDGRRSTRATVPPKGLARIRAAAYRIIGLGEGGWFVRTAVVIVALAAAAILSLDTRERTRFAVDYYAFHKRWPDVLAAARKAPDILFVMQAVNRALYHTGRLDREMFQWPQEPAALLLNRSPSNRVFWQSFDVDLDLGLVNMAENALTESLEGLGDRPMILQRLVVVNLIKDHPDTARIYLGALSRTLFHRDWAEEWLRRIEADPRLSGDLEIQTLRSMSLDRDRPSVRLPEEQMLTWLLDRNPENRMAFEYLESWFLLTKQLPKFMEPIGKLKAFGYTELPRHYEEAMLIYAYGSRKRIDIQGFKPSGQLQKRAAEFNKVVALSVTDRRAAVDQIRNRFPGTYFYYYFCVQPEKRR